MTALVVPQHATATSTSGTPLSSSSLIEYVSGGGVVQLKLSASDFSAINASSSSVVTMYGHTMTGYTLNTYHFFYKYVSPDPITDTGTGSVVIDGTTYSASINLR